MEYAALIARYREHCAQIAMALSVEPSRLRLSVDADGWTIALDDRPLTREQRAMLPEHITLRTTPSLLPPDALTSASL